MKLIEKIAFWRKNPVAPATSGPPPAQSLANKGLSSQPPNSDTKLPPKQQGLVPPASSSSINRPCWLRHGKSAKEEARGDLPSHVDVFVVSDPASLYPNVVNSLYPWNAQVFFPSSEGDLVAKVANADVNEVVNQIKNGDYELNVAYHEYVTYPVLYMTLKTGTKKQTGKPHCIECLIDYAEANFQDFVLGVQNNKKISVHIFDETGRLRATCPFQCKTQFCTDMLNYTNNADATARGIPLESRSFSVAAKQYFLEHPA